MDIRNKAKLNLDIKKLKIKYKYAISCRISRKEYLNIWNDMSNEFKRIYKLDEEFKYMNKNNLLFMIRFNYIASCVPFNIFLEHIDHK